MRRSDGLSSVSHALQVLLLFREHRSLRVHEVSRLLGLPRSTAHRLMSVLQAHRFVVQERSRGPYRIGPALINVGLAALQGIDIRRAAQPVLQALREEVRETVSLTVLDGPWVRFLESIEGPEDVRVSSRLGQSRPAHCTAAGKVLLAWLPLQELERLYPEGRLPAATPRSITRLEELEPELEAIRARGYATNFEESTPGLHAVGVTVPGPDGRPAAAIAISAPASRLPPERVPELVVAAQRAAARVEQAICGLA
ncbi:MAG TPA: IclR family transcriptional regulator [Candidatus Dormibacteraeota bacterium]|nr:IclR family transcriptional regulator [Candidatus Dormibacteraeota bacterium]